jgi:GntR family transcriptional regulator
MQITWNNDQPIYKQLRERVTTQVMNGTFAEGEAIPSVRSVATQMQVNHLTVSKAYQELVDIGILEMKRGRGMFVAMGAQQALTTQEREKFIRDEVPALCKRLDQLNLSLEDLIELAKNAQINETYHHG